jgi:hypothetical protein
MVVAVACLFPDRESLGAELAMEHEVAGLPSTPRRTNSQTGGTACSRQF